jgi:23S rRNA U2552 (ribose-2'-O)-methylase RlmE/FtsJ
MQKKQIKPKKPDIKQIDESDNVSTEKSDTENNQDTQDNAKKDYTPVKTKIYVSKNNILSEDPDPKYSKNIDYPRFSLGFQHFTHANYKKRDKAFNQFEGKGTSGQIVKKAHTDTKGKKEQTVTKLEGRKKVYLVMNPFEVTIDNYEDTIENAVRNYFGIKDGKPDIVGRGFYKMYEIIKEFKLIDSNQDNFTSVHLNDGEGGCTQATLLYREKNSKKYKNDTYNVINVEVNNNKLLQDINKTFEKHYENDKPQKLYINKSYSKQVAGGIKTMHDGDLTDPKTIKLFGGAIKKDKEIAKADLITAYGELEWKQDYTIEQEAFKLIFAEIYTALGVQKKGGSFVCKIFETFTMTSVKYIDILNKFYDEVEIYKPLVSRSFSTEKFIICKKFKYDDKDEKYKNMMKKLKKIHEDSHKNKDLNLVDIFPKYELEEGILRDIINTNIKLANMHFKSLNEVISFVENQNYYGDEYQQKRTEQINASKYWISKYLE